jgi:hypothetical protein
VRAPLRSVALAVTLTAASALWGLYVAFRWLYRHDEAIRELREDQRRAMRWHEEVR